jgi:hypothetical protein
MPGVQLGNRGGEGKIVIKVRGKGDNLKDRWKRIDTTKIPTPAILMELWGFYQGILSSNIEESKERSGELCLSPFPLFFSLLSICP